MKILFLYTELAGYFLACVRELVRQGHEVHIVRWPVNKEAPFEFAFGEGITVYNRSDYNDKQLQALAASIAPDAVVCSGWIDRDYVKVCNQLKKTAVTILALDNKWQGSLKQQFARIISPFTLKRIFKFAWVPGALQAAYARKLGFSENNIRNGFYSADTPFFAAYHDAYKAAKQQHFPHRFIFAGRYYDFKGVRELWQAFAELKEEQPNDWQLWCLGTGDVPPAEHPAIHHFGFVQPNDLHTYLEQTGVFVMPSRVEPWGVVLHEFAAAGFPLVCSSNVGAVNQFVKEGENGFVFSAGDAKNIKAALLKVINTSDENLVQMGETSAVLGKTISPQSWAACLAGMIGNH
jgi:glycosyltransferase involved in cell wall biosynthesis